MKKLLLFSLFSLSFICGHFAQGEMIFIGSWDPINYPGTCGWAAQDAAAEAAANANSGSTANPPFASFQAAFDYAVSNGTANQTVQFLPDAYVQGYDYDFAGGQDQCVGSSISNGDAVPLGMDGLTIAGSNDGCGTFIKSSTSEITWLKILSGVDNVTIRDFYFYQFSGVLEVENSENLQVINCVFDGCEKNAHEAVYVESNSEPASATFTNCTWLNHQQLSTNTAMEIRSNSTTTATNVTVDFVDCQFTCNARQGNRGGALFIGKGTNRAGSAAGPIVTFTGGSFYGNVAEAGSGEGGAISISGLSDVTITGTDFCDNVAETTTGVSGGGAIKVGEDCTVSITGSVFDGNSTVQYGGAIHAYAGFGLNTTDIVNCQFYNNTSKRGGAVYIDDEVDASITGCLFDGNISNGSGFGDNGGGGLYIDGGTTTVDIANSTFISNTTADSGAGGVSIVGNSSSDAISFVNSLLCTNSGGDLTYASSSGITIDAATVIGVGDVTQGDCAAPGAAGFAGTPRAATCGAITDCASVCGATVPGVCNTVVDEFPSVCAQSFAASICGSVFLDADDDGLFNNADVTVASILVTLYDAAGNVIGRTETDATGGYCFNDIPDGTYTVGFFPADTYPTVANAGDGTIDSEIDATFQSGPLTIDNAAGTSISDDSGTTATNFTNIDAGFSDQVLPIELLSFEARGNNNCEVIVKWSTATEINNDYFEVLRSDNGGQAEVIGTVDGAGSSFQTLNYEFVDANPIRNAYYQLRQVDIDGSSSYSSWSVVALNCLGGSGYVAGDATTGQFQLFMTHTTDANASINIYNAHGQLLYQQAAPLVGSESSHALDLSTLPAGVYMLQVADASGTLYTTKLVTF